MNKSFLTLILVFFLLSIGLSNTEQLKDGFGKAQLPDSSIYEGNLKNGLFNNKGNQLEGTSEERQEKLAKINIANGVDTEEASLLSWEYFLRFVSGCGFPEKPVDRGRYWEIKMRIGYAGEPAPYPMIIDKKTGAISLQGNRTVKTL